MGSMPPKTPVPDDWVHPDLKRQLAERRNKQELFAHRIDVLETQRGDMRDVASCLQKELADKKTSLLKLDQRRAEIAAEIEEDEKKLLELHHVYDHLCDQITLHRAAGQQNLLDIRETVDCAHSSDCAVSVGGASAWGELRSCFDADDGTTLLFFKQYAYFFIYLEEEITVCKKVTRTAFLDEMCLMETEKCSCKNVACLYWHLDQLSHVKRGFKKLCARALTRNEGNRKICDVAEMFFCLQTEMNEATELVDAIRIHRDALNCVAGLGWAAAFLGEDKAKAWTAPLLPPPQKFSMSLNDVFPLLRDSREQDIWQNVLHSASDPICTVTELFQKHADSLLWRFLMRVAGTTTERLLWLATRGVALFPTSPSIRLGHVLALLKSGFSSSDCVAACMQSASVLSVHSARLTFLQNDTHWSETAARYIAYMIAVTCVSVAEKDPEAAIGLLAWTLEVPGRVCLLPFALQNLTLLLVVLRQTKKLAGVAALPLASISDVPFALSEHFPGRTRDECGQLLSKQLDLLMGCAAAGIDAELTEFMRSAVHLSLMRVFSTDLRLVDQVLAKSAIHSPRGLAALWRDYFHYVARRDGKSSFIAFLHLISEKCQCPLLMVHIVRLFDFYGEDIRTVIASFVQRFAANREILLDSVCQMATEETPRIPVDDWIPFLILYSYTLDQRERLKFLLTVPVSSYCNFLELVIMLWLETIQCAVRLKNETVFRNCIRHGLQLLREPFLNYFSPIDCYFEEMVSFAHVASLMVYKAVPVLLGASYKLTDCYRRIVLEVSEELHVVHPYLFAEK